MASGCFTCSNLFQDSTCPGCDLDNFFNESNIADLELLLTSFGAAEVFKERFDAFVDPNEQEEFINRRLEEARVFREYPLGGCSLRMEELRRELDSINDKLLPEESSLVDVILDPFLGHGQERKNCSYYRHYGRQVLAFDLFYL